MFNQQLKEFENNVQGTRERDIEKMKFCIISCYKSQLSRTRLLMFTLENKY